jgi:hypothetical protein
MEEASAGREAEAPQMEEASAGRAAEAPQMEEASAGRAAEAPQMEEASAAEHRPSTADLRARGAPPSDWSVRW